jgi:prepilin-type N-terminal cleavage/methylation domain-containing protein
MRRAPVMSAGARRPAGFTLVEFLIAIVLFGMLGGTLVTLIMRQQRIYRAAQEELDRRAELRHAGMLLPTDLRTIFPAGGDIYAWQDSMIEFRQTVGSSVICRIPPGLGATQTIVLPPRTLARQSVLTSWIARPEVGDSVMIYDEGPFVGNNDDVWRSYAITDVTTATAAAGCNAAFTPLPADNAASSFVVTLSTAAGAPGTTAGGTIPASVLPGAPVRIFRRARYSLFRQASDGRWYLGYRDCLSSRAPACLTTPLPVAGPYLDYSTDANASGLVFTYRDAAGAVLAPGVGATTNIARIDVMTRTQTTPIAVHGQVAMTRRDSLSTSIGLRNRNTQAQ